MGLLFAHSFASSMQSTKATPRHAKYVLLIRMHSVRHSSRMDTHFLGSGFPHGCEPRAFRHFPGDPTYSKGRVVRQAGLAVGDALGLALGLPLGEDVGPVVGDALGDALGLVDGLVLGLALGLALGDALGGVCGWCGWCGW